MLPFAYSPTQLDVFNKSQEAFQQSAIARAAYIAHRYYDGTAYMGTPFSRTGLVPLAFGDWDRTLYGEPPPCCPIPKRITEIAAQFLFGDTPHIQVGDPEDDSETSLQAFLDDVILRPNHFYDQLLDEGRACSIEGGTEYKWNWQIEDDEKCPVLIQTYHPYETIYFRDDLNPEKIETVRIQFKYCDRDTQWWWYREEWTKEAYTVYRKLPTLENDDTQITRFMQDNQWPIDYRKANLLQLIPIQKVYNRKRKGLYEGIGDYWEPNLYRLMDIYNRKTWGEDFSDQTEADPTVVFIDVEYGGKRIPGQWMSTQSMGEHPDVKQIKTDNPVREYMRLSKQDVRKEIFDGAGYDDVDPSLITNKGNLTYAVLKMTFSKSVDSTKAKRVLWGLALEQFFEGMMEGLSRLEDAKRLYPALKKVNLKDPKSFDVTVNWPDDFDYSPEEVADILANLGVAVTSGFLTQERATAMSAKAFKITDISELLDELKGVHGDMETIREAGKDLAVNEAAAAGDPTGAGQGRDNSGKFAAK